MLTVELIWKPPTLLSELDLEKPPSKAGEMERPETRCPPSPAVPPDRARQSSASDAVLQKFKAEYIKLYSEEIWG